MTAISNKTRKPVSVPLPGGKILHLGPGKTGQIAAKAVDDSRLKELIAAGEIEIVGEEARPNAGPGGGKRGRTPMLGHTSGSHRSGDR